PGQSLPQALLEPLGPRAQDQELLVAARATLPPPHAQVAVVAAQALGGAMVGQAHVAVGAGGALATGGAEDEGGVPPAVEEEDRLLTPLEGGKELLEEASRKDLGLLCVARFRRLAEVDDLHLRQAAAVEAPGEDEARVLTP